MVDKDQHSRLTIKQFFNMLTRSVESIMPTKIASLDEKHGMTQKHDHLSHGVVRIRQICKGDTIDCTIGLQ